MLATGNNVYSALQLTNQHTYIHTYIHIWEKAEKKCTLVEITVPLDNNLQKAPKEETRYINLISKMQWLYRGYIFEVIVVAVGAMGAVPVPLEENLKNYSQKMRTLNH